MKLPESTATVRSRGSSVVQPDRQRAGVDARRRWSGRRTARRASGSGRDRPRECVGPPAGARRDDPEEVRGRRGDVAEHAQVDRPVRAEARGVEVDLHHVRPGPISAPWRVVHMFRAQPQPTTRSASRSARRPAARRSRRRSRATTGSPANRPVRHGPGREQRAGVRRPSSSAARDAAARAPRPATNTGRSAVSSRASPKSSSIPQRWWTGRGPPVTAGRGTSPVPGHFLRPARPAGG